MIQNLSTLNFNLKQRKIAYVRYLHIMSIAILICSNFFFACNSCLQVNPNHYRMRGNKMLFADMKNEALRRLDKNSKHTLSKDDMNYIKWNQHIILNGEEVTPIKDSIKFDKVVYNVRLDEQRDGLLFVSHPVFTGETLEYKGKKHTIPRFIKNVQSILYEHSGKGVEYIRKDLNDPAKANGIIHDRNRQKLSDDKNDTRSSDTRTLSDTTLIKKGMESISLTKQNKQDVINLVSGMLSIMSIDLVKKALPNVDVDAIAKSLEKPKK